MSKTVTAAFLVIGNEILSGRTADKNINTLAKRLNLAGIQLREVRVVPDIEEEIIEAVNHLRNKHHYLFTSGGIGPTHDDITAECIAKAFDLPLITHEEAKAILMDYYQEGITEARLRMARMPQSDNLKLIENAVSAAPGFNLENVYVMAGVPKIFQSMLDEVIPQLEGGDKILSEALSAFIPESRLAQQVTDIQKANRDVDIGSYPQMIGSEFGVTIVIRGLDATRLQKVKEEIRTEMLKLTSEIQEGEFERK